MRVKKTNKQIIISAIAILLIVIIGYTVFSCSQIAIPDKYRPFYLFKYTHNNRVMCFTLDPTTDYYYLPGQKIALRMKIKSDVKEMAKSIGENYPDVVEDIYVSDDLRVHVTIYKGANLYDINEELETIRFSIQLYHELYGDSKSDFFDIRKSRNTKP